MKYTVTTHNMTKRTYSASAALLWLSYYSPVKVGQWIRLYRDEKLIAAKEM